MFRFKICLVITFVLAAMAWPAIVLVPGQDSYLPTEEQNLNLASHAFVGARKMQEVAQEALAIEIATCPHLGAALGSRVSPYTPPQSMAVALNPSMSTNMITATATHTEKVEVSSEGDLTNTKKAKAQRRKAKENSRSKREKVTTNDGKGTAIAPLTMEERKERHHKVWEQLNSWQSRLKKVAEDQSSEGSLPTATHGQLILTGEQAVTVPDLMVVLDGKGEGVANMGDYTWFGNNLTSHIPQVVLPLQTGHIARHIWNVEGTLMDVVIHPMFTGTRSISGALILGFAINNQTAQAYSSLLNKHVVFVAGQSVIASSQDAPAAQYGKLFSSDGYMVTPNDHDSIPAPTSTTAPASTDDTKVKRVKVKKSYLLTRVLPIASGVGTGNTGNSGNSGNSGNAGNADNISPATTKLMAILIKDVSKGANATTQYFMMIGAIFFGLIVLSILLTNVLISSFLKPFQKLKGGVDQVMGGNLQYVFTGERGKKSSHVSAISKCLNFLLKELRETTEQCDELARDNASSAAPSAASQRHLGESGKTGSPIRGQSTAAGHKSRGGAAPFAPMFPYQSDHVPLPAGESATTPQLDEAFREIADRAPSFQQDVRRSPFPISDGTVNMRPSHQPVAPMSESDFAAPAGLQPLSGPMENYLHDDGPAGIEISAPMIEKNLAADCPTESSKSDLSATGSGDTAAGITTTTTTTTTTTASATSLDPNHSGHSEYSEYSEYSNYYYLSGNTEGDSSYYANLFRDYLDARKANGESFDSITFEKFHTKVLQSETMLKEKNGLKNIRFKIQIKDGRVSLKPIAID